MVDAWRISNQSQRIYTTGSGRQIAPVKELWDGLATSIKYLRLAAVSLPDIGEATVSSMKDMYSVMEPDLCCFNLWQLDGHPMSGDIGRGATGESVASALHLAAIKDRPHVDGLKKVGLFQTSFHKNSRDEMLTGSSSSAHAINGGVAYGGYARKNVGRILSSMQSQHDIAASMEDYPDHLLLVGTFDS